MIVIKIKGNISEKAEDVITTDWARYNEKEDYTLIKIPGEKEFITTAQDIYSGLGEILLTEYI